jgi:hypothetical protein
MFCLIKMICFLRSETIWCLFWAVLTDQWGVRNEAVSGVFRKSNLISPMDFMSVRPSVCPFASYSAYSTWPIPTKLGMVDLHSVLTCLFLFSFTLAHFIAFRHFGTRRFISVFTRARHWPLSWAKCMQSTPYHTISLRSILILFSHLHLGLQVVSSLHVFSTKILYATLSSMFYIVQYL